MVCPKCGRVLVQGEICPCEMAAIRKRNIELQTEKEIEEQQLAEEQAAKEAARRKKADKAFNAANKAKDITANISNNIIQDISAIVSAPKRGIKDFVEEENMVNALILMGINALLISILATISFSSSIIGSLAIYLDMANKFVIWLMMFLTGCVGCVSGALGFMLIGKIQKNSMNFKQALCLSAPKAIFCVPVLLVSMVLMLLNTYIGLGGFILSLLVGVCVDSVSFGLINNNQEKGIYYLAGIEAVSTFVTLIMLIIAVNVIF